MQCGVRGLCAKLGAEAGGGSVLGLAVIVALAAAVVAFAPFGAALARHQMLVGAADSAALAAADTASGRVPGSPCEAAAAVASALDVVLISCSIDGTGAREASGHPDATTPNGPVAEVAVSTTIVGIPVTARARAGPFGAASAARPGGAAQETTAST